MPSRQGPDAGRRLHLPLAAEGRRAGPQHPREADLRRRTYVACAQAMAGTIREAEMA